MAEFVVKVGAYSAQGLRPNNEDRFVADAEHLVFLVADGMGGQEFGEQASGLAAEIIPRVVQDKLAKQAAATDAVRTAFDEANQAIIQAGQNQALGRRMGTTAVLALLQPDQVFVAGLGDSRAYLVRGDRVEQLTVDHTLADALERNGSITAEQARHSPYRNSLYKFLGCTEMSDGAEVRPFAPRAGDHLILASDGLTNHITIEDLRDGAAAQREPQEWCESLVTLALERGSRDNVTCIIIVFHAE